MHNSAALSQKQLVIDLSAILAEIIDEVAEEIIATGRASRTDYVRQIAEIAEVFIDEIVDTATPERDYIEK